MSSAAAEVVLRELPAECLEQGQLRDGIAERLERLQQAAHPRLANLLGVRQIDDHFYLAWQAINGRPLAEVVDDLSEQEIHRLLGDLIDAVEGLHLLGLVHGDLNVGNIIVASDGVYLTDASPLLWTDPERDVRTVTEIFHRCGMAAPADDQPITLRRLASFLDGAYVPRSAAGRESAVRLKRNNFIWAILLLLLAIAAAVAISWYVHRPAGGMLQSHLPRSDFA